MAEPRFKASQTVAQEVMAKGRARGSTDKVSTKPVRRQPVDQGSSASVEKINTKAAGRPKGPERKPLLITLEPAMIERVDNWGFKNGIGKRVEAIRALLEKGLG